MRFLIVGAAIVTSASLLSAQVPQAPPEQPVFRAGVELISVDVTALDGNGHQVTDLAAADFLVDVDGDARQVVSAEYVRSVDPLRVIGAPRKVVAPPDEAFFTSNAKGAPSGRVILLLIDQGNIRTGAARMVMNNAKKFVDTLTPEDRVAVVAVPGPGELVDFTTDHDKVREALLRIVGSADPLKGRFNLTQGRRPNPRAKLATWTYKEPGTNKVRVMVAAEVERLSGQPLDYTAGILLITKTGRGLAPPVAARTLTEKVGDPGTAVYAASMAVDPGEYRLVLSMADSEGRVGSVSRLVTAWQMDGPALALGDLVVGGSLPGQSSQLVPAIEPAVTGGEMAALVEVYGSPAQLTGVAATLEILTTEDSAPLATMPMRMVAGPSPEIAAGTTQFSTTALPPGRYLARSVIRQGGKPQGHMIRPFRIVIEAPSLTSGAPAPTAGGIDADIRRSRGTAKRIEGRGEGSTRRRPRFGGDDRTR